MSATDESVGRNNPCPCGSGKKYKHCCLGKSKPAPFGDATFPEQFVIADILRSSAEFAAFYAVERPKIKGELLWARDRSLPVGIDRRFTCDNHGLQVIRLRRLPAPIGDAMGIAHELGHCVLEHEGFPRVGFRDFRFETISSSLSSMVQDLIVNQRLKAFGFDLREDYLSEARESLRQLSGISSEPQQPVDKLHFVFNFAANLLDVEQAFTTAQEDPLHFDSWFSERFHQVAAEGHRLAEFVKRHGYETPEQARTVFAQIIRHYNLSNILIVSTPSPTQGS